ncbi:MAG: 2,3-bisphosphoglycerate-independent phosphoglycerate mutase [Candidatus Woesearchaeota archaeon]
MPPVALIILDGWGLRKSKYYNAVALASTPNYLWCLKNHPNSRLKAHGEFVGLPKGYQGNSETGHLNIGAGRVVKQQVTVIYDSIKRGTFFKRKELLDAIKNCKTHNSAFHIMGLVQQEGVHAMTEHGIALLKLAYMHRLKDIYFHVFTDGRDTEPRSAKKHTALVEKAIKKYKTCRIGVVVGRYYAMDRDKRWNRVKVAYDALVHCKGRLVSSLKEAIDLSYQSGESDEFIKPKIIKGYRGMRPNDSVVFFNYRLDRARELTKALVEPDFKEFKTTKMPLFFVAMTPYYDGMNVKYLFPNIELKNLLGEVISTKGLKQMRIAETEKYAHVTFFFNGQREKPFPHEERILVPSPKVATYDKKPEMSAYIVRDKVLSILNKYDFIVINFANPDMVGHTGNLRAAVKAVEAVDSCLGSIVRELLRLNGKALIIADHGNCEEMFGKHKTSHTTNETPCIMIGQKMKESIKLKNGKLADVAPTILKMLNIKKPVEMTGQALF